MTHQIKQDTLKLTPSLARAMRRAFVTGTITENNALYALECYKQFLRIDCKRPFLHNEQWGIVCPMCPEAVAQIESNFGIRLKEVSPYWERQSLRYVRRQRLNEWLKQKKLNAQSTKIAEITPIQKVVENDPLTDEFNATNMAKTQVIWKVSGGMLIAMVFLDGAKKKSATVYHVKDGIVSYARNGSCAQKYTQDELDQKGWQTGKLGDERFARIFAMLTDPKFEQQPNPVAAVA